VTPQGSVVIGVGNFSTFAPGQPPSVPAPTAQASSAVAQALANLITVAVPINTPAVLEASATAAAAVAQARLLAAQAAADPDNAALQLAALDAARLAQEAVLAAILAAQGAYDEALDGGGVKYDPDPASILDSDTAAAVQQLITPTGSSSSGSGGTSCGVSCN